MAGCGSDSKSNAIDTSPASTAARNSSATAGPSPTQSASSSGSEATGVAPAPAGNGAAGDVAVGKQVTSGELGLASVKVTVTNHSSQRSDYVVELALVSANGMQLGTKEAFVNDVGPGQSTTRPEIFQQSYNAVPAGARVSLRTVQRYPSG
ncbi:FxLYD domain-containing protein [uncultured Jatrophihabitans sp.]|uniref:FxLYD domain-containing protein n=1 Tax=uncultured Jatrophihabitans sp. TaxID=1610747 RepID=UPI0035CB4283